MQHEDLTYAVTASVAFYTMLAGHYFGDQWAQTSGQASKKALNGPETAPVAVWHCAKHVITWSISTMVFLLVACWWLQLPLRPSWLAAGIAVNAVSHFVADLRTPLIWLARLMRHDGYIEFAQVMRPSGAQKTGPGTGLFHLDQAWHVAWLVPASLLIAGHA